MASQSPLEQWQNLVKSNKFVFLVSYRGHWCPFCMSWLKQFAELSPRIEAAGGVPVILTSEASMNDLAATRSATGFNGTAIIDPENTVPAWIKSQGGPHIAISEKKGYEHGMMQPGVLVLSPEKGVLQKWAIVPSMMNMGGAKDRPVLSEIWANAQAQLDGKSVPYQTPSTIGAFSVLKGKMFG